MVYANMSMPVQALFSDIGREASGYGVGAGQYTGIRYLSDSGTFVMTFSALDDAGICSQIFYNNVATNIWGGPWLEDTTCSAVAYIGYPEKHTLLVGNALGQIKYLAFYENANNTATLASALIDGRSVDPSLPTMTKSWKRLRILYNPTGKWNLTASWKCDFEGWKSNAKHLAPKILDAVGQDWKVSSSQISSRDNIAVLEFDLDCSGRGVKFELETDAPRMALIGWEIDFLPTGNEKD